MTVAMPSYFVPHGAGPCFFMDWQPADAWDTMAAYLRNIAAQLPERPKAIVVVSAHWQAEQFLVTSAPEPELIFDYYGFPPHTYELEYPAPGEPALAKRIVSFLNQAGLPAAEDAQRGWDHGVFIPLLMMFPEADIPVVQLSLRHDLDPAAHQAVGRALSELREEGVLIVGSGMSFHNMRGYGDPSFTPDAAFFDRWLTEAVGKTGQTRIDALNHWSQAPSARRCHPPRQEEHLLPLMVAAGAAENVAGQRDFTDQVLDVALSGFVFR